MDTARELGFQLGDLAVFKGVSHGYFVSGDIFQLIYGDDTKSPLWEGVDTVAHNGESLCIDPDKMRKLHYVSIKDS